MILFNTHARTGSYLAYQLVLRNLVSSKVIHKHELENIINAIANSVWGTDLPTSFNHIKNPTEPFAGISLDTYELDHPFGNNYQEISDEFFSLLEDGKMFPLTSANIWNESKYVKPEVLKEKYGYKIFTLYRKNIKAWYVSLNLAFTAGIKSFHAVDDSSADYILNKRKSLIGKLKVDIDNIKDFKSSIERYVINSIPVTDGWFAYEDLVSNPQSFIEAIGFARYNQKINIDKLTTRKIEQPVNNILEYYEDPNEFERVWSEVWKTTKR